jgi:RHS repeat-associated protein
MGSGWYTTLCFDYSPFGVTLSGRNFTLTGAKKGRYAFNGMEDDPEVKGQGNSYDYGARMHDPRVGRFLSIDPQAGAYPFMSPYCYAGNNPIYFTDENGEGPKPAKGKRTRAAILKVSASAFAAIYSSNNTSVREVERWALGEFGYDKSTLWKLKGAVGEAYAFEAIYGLMNAASIQNGLEYDMVLQQRTPGNNRRTSDVCLTFALSTYLGSGGTIAQTLDIGWNDANGNEYNEMYAADGRIDTDEFKFQFEVKTLTPQTSNAGVRRNVRALNYGLDQLEDRNDDHSPILFTDKEAYLAIVHKANAGGRASKKFIERMTDFIDDGGHLMLMEDLNKMSYERTLKIRDAIIKANPKETKHPTYKAKF